MRDMQRDQDQPLRRFRISELPSLREIRSALDGISEHFCLLLAMDATTTSDRELREAAKLLLKRGITYLCVWGPDCERVHDLFDLERMPHEPKDRVVMTTWHSKEPLSEALWFFATCVEPADGFASTCTDWIALSVRNAPWMQEMQTYLEGQDRAAFFL